MLDGRLAHKQVVVQMMDESPRPHLRCSTWPAKVSVDPTEPQLRSLLNNSSTMSRRARCSLLIRRKVDFMPYQYGYLSKLIDDFWV
jgi:hypothetical protein